MYAIAPPEPSSIPSKIQAAQAFLYFCQNKTQGNSCGTLPGDAPHAGDDLSPKEQATYDAALNCLCLYFNGEMDFDPAEPVIPHRRDDDDPHVPQTAEDAP